MFKKLLQTYKQEGWFDKYPVEHIVYPALASVRVQFEDGDIEYIEGIKSVYSTFIANFLKTLEYIKVNFDMNSYEWIVREYLACEHGYSDKEFLFRYSNILIICGFKAFNIDVKQCELFVVDNKTIFRLIREDGIVLQFFAGVLDRGNTKEMMRQDNSLELEVGLTRRDIEQLQNRACKENISIAPINIQQVVDEMTKGAALDEDEKIYNICLLHLMSDNIDGYNILTIKGMFLNKYTGLFVNDILHEEYYYNENVCKKISGVLSFQYSLQFFVYGDIRYLLDKEHHFFAVNRLGSKYWDKVYPFVQSDVTDKIMGIYNPTSQNIIERFNFYIALMLENYKKPLSTTFTNKEVLLIEGNIQRNLIDAPQLLRPFELDLHKATEEILKKYELMYAIIREKYPCNHPFRSEGFLFDAMSFSLAYCMFVVPTYLNNTTMIEDFLRKKLVCKKDGKFNRKVFNESYSEFEIFFYIFVGIFCNSERYKNFLKLEYEPDGNQNKRFEYAFIFSDYKINVEVKALECAPEEIDSISLARMKNGTRFYKNYFHAYDENEVIPPEVLQKAKKLKSNYRQVSKNIKKIKEKCVEEDGFINLGFLMINYGTSREEYISYLLNRGQGYLRKNPLDKLDALILFSMCIDTDLMMEKILEEEHIFVFPNLKKNNDALLSDLRLNNYVSEQEDNPYVSLFDDMYGEYIGINSGGIVTIQRADVTETEWERAQDIISRIEEDIQELVRLSK